MIRINESVNESSINEAMTRIDLDMSELTEEMLIDAANKCAHYTKWCKMDSSEFTGVYELKSYFVDINNGTFCFAKYNGNRESLEFVLKNCNENNHSKYGEFEVFSTENSHGIWLCGKMTKLYTYKEINESFVLEENSEFIEKIGAYHLEPKIGNKKPAGRGWDEELYSKDIESAIVNDIKSNYIVKGLTTVHAYVFTAGKNLKAIYLGTILIEDKNNPNSWKWEDKTLLSDDDYDYLKLNPLSESYVKEAKNDKGEEVPKVCPKCGSKIGVFLKGEPVFLCTNKECNKFFGVVPFHEAQESAISEGVIDKDMPREIKTLGENIKKLIDTRDEDIEDLLDVVKIAKDSLKGKDYSGNEKKIIYDICKKLSIDIFGYTKKVTNIKGVEITNRHTIIGTFKDYILTIKFIGIKGDVKLQPLGISINYNSKTSSIPKSIAFDSISILKPVDKVKATKNAIKISALSDAIDSGYPRLNHKYSTSYKVKKNIGGFSVTLSKLFGDDIFKEDSPIAGAMHRQDYQPDAVYIINYLKKNTFVRDLAVCRDKMSTIFVCDNGEPVFTSLTDFKEMAEDIKMYKCLLDPSFDRVVRVSKSGLDFYRNMVWDDKVEISTLESDFRFTRVPSYLDELNSIEECIINSVPKSGIVHEIYCPVIPLVDLNVTESSVHYFRDINGVFAQNIDTLARSASYKSVDDIPKTTINLLKQL